MRFGGQGGGRVGRAGRWGTAGRADSSRQCWWCRRWVWVRGGNLTGIHMFLSLEARTYIAFTLLQCITGTPPYCALTPNTPLHPVAPPLNTTTTTTHTHQQHQCVTSTLCTAPQHHRTLLLPPYHHTPPTHTHISRHPRPGSSAGSNGHPTGSSQAAGPPEQQGNIPTGLIPCTAHLGCCCCQCCTSSSSSRHCC